MQTSRQLILAGSMLALCGACMAQSSVTQTTATETTTTEQMTGVSTPPPDVSASVETPAADAAVAVTPAPVATSVTSSVVTTEVVTAPAETPAPVAMASVAPVTPVAGMRVEDPDADIVASVISRPGEVASGTLLYARIAEPMSTSFTQRGDRFTAKLMKDVTANGLVVVPAGSELHGRVTESSETRAVMGRAKLHLRADEIVLPDGTRLVPHAVVIDTDQHNRTKVDSEGTILSKKMVAQNLTITGTLAGTGAVAGAVMGGPGGAAIGTLVGAGVGAGHWMRQEQSSNLPQNALVVFELTAPMSIVPGGTIQQ